jgi:hypothetical protein
MSWETESAIIRLIGLLLFILGLGLSALVAVLIWRERNKP